MERKIILTKDGSHTVSVPELNVTYHSVHGALQESKHVFIEAGLKHFLLQNNSMPLYIFEMGFGTGLNALLTLAEAASRKTEVFYECVEMFPLDRTYIRRINYTSIDTLSVFTKEFNLLHTCNWETVTNIHPCFTLLKRRDSLINLSTDKLFNLIYYDAFAPAAQPELWTQEIFVKLFALLYPGGLLVTYCSKGDVRRALQAAGFRVEKIPGPPGKREMIRAVKNGE